MAFLSPSNDTRVNLLLMMADLRSAGVDAPQGASTVAATDAPLFTWEQLANKFGSPRDKAALRANEMPGQNPAAPCPDTLPPDDPFTLAVQADRELKADERAALLEARLKARSGCPPNAAASVITSAEAGAKTASAKAYATYLEGAAAFWRADYEKAAATFSSLAKAGPAWVRETATYMIGRSLIDRAQVGAFDEYGAFNKDWHADSKTVAGAEAALDAYLQQYPQGMYAQSARGLKRRGYWLAQDTAKLEGEYGALLLLTSQQRNISDVELVQEIDNKLTTPPGTYGTAQSAGSVAPLLSSTQDPLLLAMEDLLVMRQPDPLAAGGPSPGDPPISLASLQQQKPYFAAQMPLYQYLLAVHALYVENKPDEVLRLIPDAARQDSFTYVQFSRQVLRGMALEALRDHNALGFWTQMLPGAKAAYERPALELAIAYHDERTGKVLDVFAPDSPVHYPYLREVLLANVADADLLRTEARNANVPQREREIALFTLLYKEGTRGHAADFLKDLPLVPSTAPTEGLYMLDGNVEDFIMPDGDYQPAAIPLGVFLHDQTNSQFGCPGLKASEEQLAKDATNATARLCVADFVRLNESVMYLGATAPSPNDLGGGPSLFPGTDFARMDVYTAVLAEARSNRNEKAYALYRAVNCYGPSGSNHCGGKDVPVSQRKAWFTTLKHDYAGTRWANELEYYW